MKKVLVSVLAVVAGTAFFSSCGNNVKTAKMESYMDTVSYAQGFPCTYWLFLFSLF